MKKNNYIHIIKILVVVIIANIVASFIHYRLDLTQDHRYTLSKASVTIAKSVKKPIIVDVLLEGTIPAEFNKLKEETKQMLEEFSAINSNIKFNFVDPFDDDTVDKNTIVHHLQSIGLTPANITVADGSKTSQELVIPWAMAYQDKQTVRVPLLKNKIGATTEQRITNSVQQLEYVFADAFKKLTTINKKKIAVLRGNGELDDLHKADFLSTLREHYSIAPFTLDSVTQEPQKTLNELENYDMVLIAKPTKPFTDAQKYVLDQYTVNGGKSLWLIDQVDAEIDSLYNPTGKTFAIPRDLNLKDMLFKYGVRINPDLVNDLYFTQIVLANGEGNNAQYNPVPWLYNPMVFSKNNHPINNNIDALKFEFTSPIDTLKNTLKKTILLQSSPLSKLDGTPREISLEMVTQQPKKEEYGTNGGNYPLAVLLEGKFTSAFKNRVKPLKLSGVKDDAEKASKMIVISDGDLIKNQIRNGRPLELGYDKWTNSFYGNKEFLMNCVNYLLDDDGLINIRSKKIKISFLDEEKVASQKTTWQAINLLLPTGLLLLFGFGYGYYRKRKYTS
ncbi:gliding motility-associated ABC transporter substrate-binding protein GldG [Zhouia sp. PK063]|uniref:gliding motility-associated ABC transporter substrate-binding protein GldG n=1 Tax=Zhouia sp. PK063 TaxID=3373602 RepID=UPI0037A5F6E9